MKERPILFNGEMVRAILDGRKTQTRRMVKNLPASTLDVFFDDECDSWCRSDQENGMNDSDAVMIGLPPFGTIGDRLWVRETWRCRGGSEYEYQKHQPSIMYRADANPVDCICNNWTPSIHMPRWASRITLEITGVRVDRLNDISEDDAKAEGVFRRMDGPHMEYSTVPNGTMHWNANAAFRDLWQSIYGNWDANPWVWVYEFRKI